LHLRAIFRISQDLNSPINMSCLNLTLGLLDVLLGFRFIRSIDLWLLGSCYLSRTLQCFVWSLQFLHPFWTLNKVTQPVA
jgi:hypothetical protein